MGFSRQEYWSGVPLPSPNLGLYIYILVGYVTASQNYRYYLQLAVSTTARPSKLGFYPTGNKESTLNGMKKYFQLF